MGHVNTKITLKNIKDKFKAEVGLIQEPEIRQATIDVMVDTGATMLVINEQLFEQLGLDATGERNISLANDTKEMCKLTEAVEINWEDRSITMPAVVVKDASEYLLGVLPLEGMDLMVDPVNQKLVGIHGDQPVYLAKNVYAMYPLLPGSVPESEKANVPQGAIRPYNAASFFDLNFYSACWFNTQEPASHNF